MALIVAFLVTVVVTPAVARLAIQLGIVDRPGPLKLQRTPIPYLGGLAVGLGLFGPLLFSWPQALIPLGLALALGLADDRAALPLTVRVPCEFGIGIAAILVVPGLNPVTAVIFVLGLVLLINATNLLDGLDGLATGTVAMGAFGFIFVSVPGPDALALALTGALAAFLVWNRPPARIFLGDAGSYLLGTALALLVGSMLDNDELGLSRSTPALLFIAAPMVDTLVAVVRRHRAGQPLSRGDRGHIYDQLLARGVSGPNVAAMFIIAQGVLVGLGLVITTLPSEVAWIATAGIIAMISAAAVVTFTDPHAAWADNSPVVDVLGTAVRLETPHQYQAHLRQLVAGLVTGRPATTVLALEPNPDGSLRLVEDGELVHDGIQGELAEATVIWRLNEVASVAEGYHVIHAGCIARGGRAVMLPGRSGAGKSELCAACIAKGYTYLSDEQAALDLKTGLLSPYAKPLGLGQTVVAPTALGPKRPVAPTPPAAIVFPTYDSQVTEPHSTAVPPALTLLGLCAHSKQVDRTAFLWLAGVARSCPAFAVTYAHSADGVAAVRAALAAAPADPTVSPANPTSSGPQLPGITAVAMEEDIVLFREDTETVHHLNRSAAFVWRRAAEARGAALVDACLAAAPTGALNRDDVVATVDWLSTSGLLGATADSSPGQPRQTGGERANDEAAERGD